MLTKGEKCEAILRRLVEQARHGRVLLSPNGCHGLTVGVEELSCQPWPNRYLRLDDDGDMDKIIDNLYNSLHPDIAWHGEDHTQVVS